jgi:hypothetical protein
MTLTRRPGPTVVPAPHPPGVKTHTDVTGCLVTPRAHRPVEQTAGPVVQTPLGSTPTLEIVMTLAAASSYPLLNVFWTFLWFFCLVLWFWLLFRVFADLFRRDDIGGWGKAGWTIFVIFLPFLGVFTYLIVEGRAMADRDVRQAQAVKEQTDEYIRSVAAGNGHAGSGHSGVDEIARAQQLLDSGAITADEFAQLKQRTLA